MEYKTQRNSRIASEFYRYTGNDIFRAIDRFSLELINPSDESRINTKTLGEILERMEIEERSFVLCTNPKEYSNKLMTFEQKEMTIVNLSVK